jgi:hypothetical protein
MTDHFQPEKESKTINEAVSWIFLNFEPVEKFEFFVNSIEQPIFTRHLSLLLLLTFPPQNQPKLTPLVASERQLFFAFL